MPVLFKKALHTYNTCKKCCSENHCQKETKKTAFPVEMNLGFVCSADATLQGNLLI